METMNQGLVIKLRNYRIINKDIGNVLTRSWCQARVACMLKIVTLFEFGYVLMFMVFRCVIEIGFIDQQSLTFLFV
jgi:hypothetical protein